MSARSFKGLWTSLNLVLLRFLNTIDVEYFKLDDTDRVCELEWHNQVDLFVAN